MKSLSLATSRRAMMLPKDRSTANLCCCGCTAVPGEDLRSHTSSLLPHSPWDSGPIITTGLRILCGISCNKFQSQIKVGWKLSAPSFLSLLWKKQSKPVRPVTRKMSFYPECKTERTCAESHVWRCIHMHVGLWVCLCEYTSVSIVPAGDKLA